MTMSLCTTSDGKLDHEGIGVLYGDCVEDFAKRHPDWSLHEILDEARRIVEHRTQSELTRYNVRHRRACFEVSAQDARELATDGKIG